MFRKALITGSSGFIGGALVDAWKNDVEELDIKEGWNICLPGVVRNKMNGVDIVFHQAGAHLIDSFQDPVKDAQVNIGGTLNVLREAGMKKIPVVMASTGSVHGLGGVPGTYYGVSKKCAELYADYVSVLHGIPISVLRYFSVYGPGMQTEERGVIGIWLRSIKEGRPIIVEGGDQKRAFIHVRDVVSANLVAAEGPGGLFEVGTPEMISMNALAHKLVERYGKAQVQRTLPRPGDDMRMVADTSSMSNLGWKAEVGLNDGLDETWEWICKTY